MSFLLTIARAGAALLLGVVIFVGFLFFLVLNNLSDKLLNADFYADTISGQDTYNRIYAEVLLDDELVDRAREFLGDIEIVTHQDIVDQLRKVVPPDYIQDQVEDNIERSIAYFKEDVDELEVYFDLAEPLERVKPVMFDYLDDRIDEIEVEAPGIQGCTPGELNDLAGRYVGKFNQLAEGVVPQSVPSLQEIPLVCRVAIFELAFGRLVDETSLDNEARENLKSGKADLRKPFESGDTLEVFKVSARLLAGPLIDRSIEKVREDLDAGDRLDLIRQLADWDDTTSEADIRSDLDEGRRWVSRAENFGELTTLLMVIGGSILMGLVFYPRLANMLRWPGITLLFTGAVFFVLGKIAESQVPARLTDVIETGTDKISDVPPSVTDLGGDLLISFGTQITSGIAGPSLLLLIIGLILFAASFFTAPIKRFVPFLN
ncbi:MAG: hypothetical protein O2913_08320 [Chloroflexi bacterium]|nr:hypothetical protein [Chloroflexota bacterium]